MSCDLAFRAVARSCLADLAANRAATCRGNPVALHQMRIALTRLRAAISFFAPMLADAGHMRLKRELKWLNALLGSARDIDVAIVLLQQTRRRHPADRRWLTKRRQSHLDLTQALRSLRYRRLIADVSGWVENGRWTRNDSKQAEKRRRTPIAHYASHKLQRWRRKILKKSRKLEDMTAKERHRLRLAGKRLRYAIEFFTGLPAKKTSARATLQCLRRAQDALGELNDALRVRPARVFDSKQEKRLLRAARQAYRRMASQKPLRM